MAMNSSTNEQQQQQDQQRRMLDYLDLAQTSANLTASDEPPIDCTVLKVAAGALFLIFVACVVSNIILLRMFATYKHLKTPMSAFLVALTVLNLVGSLITHPLVIISKFSCKWVFGHIGCTISGFSMYFVGCTSIFLMAVISIDKFLSIKKPMIARNMKLRTRMLALLACALIGLFWSSMPLFGWSRYALEPTKTSCSVEWTERSLAVNSYNTAMFLFVFVIPLVIIVVFNVKIVVFLNTLRTKTAGCKFKYKPPSGTLTALAMMSSGKSKKSQMARIRGQTIQTAVIMVLYVLIFVFSWLPYAVISFYTTFVNHSGIEPIYSLLPTMCAKSAVLWSSLYYLKTNYTYSNRPGINRAGVVTFHRSHSRILLNMNVPGKQDATTNAANELNCLETSINRM